MQPAAQASLLRLEAYVRALPRGLASYPDCAQKGSLVRQFVEDNPTIVRFAPAAPPEVRAALVSPPLVSEWFPEVLGNAVFAFARDVLFPTDEAFAAAIYRFNEQLFRKPMYRMLMALVSPERIVTGASGRWSAFHRGSAMSTTMRGPRRAHVVVTFPRALFGRVHLVQYAAVIRAAVVAGGANDVRIEQATHEAARFEFEISWL